MSQPNNFYGQPAPDSSDDQAAAQYSQPVSYSQPKQSNPAEANYDLNVQTWQPRPSQAVAPAYAQPFQSDVGAQPYLVRIGNITVTKTEVRTPNGNIPLSQASFFFTDQTYTTRKTPTWAIVCAIVGFFVVFLFSLFFLLAKETETTGQVMVGVQGGGVHYSEYWPVFSTMQVQDAVARINYANQVAASQR